MCRNGHLFALSELWSIGFPAFALCFSKFHILIALVHIHLAIFDCRCDAFARSHRHFGTVVFLAYFLLSEFHLVLFRFDSFVFICLVTLTIV